MIVRDRILPESLIQREVHTETAAKGRDGYIVSNGSDLDNIMIPEVIY